MTLAGLKARRLAAGLTQAALARRADCSTSMVRIIEGGFRASDDITTRLAFALECDPEDLQPIEQLLAA